MGEVSFILIPLLVGGCSLWLNHVLAKRQRWVAAFGVVFGCIAVGVFLYERSNAASGYDGVGWAAAVLVLALPALVGAVIGLGTGAWAGRRA
jgi:uncharacterized membrane protein